MKNLPIIKLFFKKKKTKRIGDILSSFNDTIKDLQTLEAGNATQVERNIKTIESLNQSNDGLQVESTRAAAVRSRITEFVS